MTDAKHQIVLVAEDNSGDYHLIKLALKEVGLSDALHLASNGVTALEFLRKEGKHADSPDPDLILLDLNLPMKNGFETLQEIKADSRLRRIPVVVFTGSSSYDDVRRSYDLDVNGFVTKPTSFKEFKSVIQSITRFWLTHRLEPRGQTHD